MTEREECVTCGEDVNAYDDCLESESGKHQSIYNAKRYAKRIRVRLWCGVIATLNSRVVRVVVLLVVLVGCDNWREEHEQRCAAWTARATTASDSLHVEMTCAQLVATRNAEMAVMMAMSMSAVAVTSK